MWLAASGVVFGYGREPLLEGVNLDVRVGESVAILGPSGVGKSTLLALLGGLLEPTRGEVVWHGPDQQPGSPRPWASWVLQTTNVLPNRSVLDNVALAGFADGQSRPRAEAAARSRLREVGLTDLMDAPTRQLSGGELQRVAVARALTSKRPLVLADEPTGQLDDVNSSAVIDLLLHCAGGSEQTRKAVVLVTHDREVAERCDRMASIRDRTLSWA